MKLGGDKLEGSPEEIKDFFENNGLTMDDYLYRPTQPLKTIWFITPICFFLISFFWLTLSTPTSTVLQNFIFLSGCIGGLCLSVSVQIQFKNIWAAVLIAVGAILILLVALGAITPLEMLEHIDELKK